MDQTTFKHARTHSGTTSLIRRTTSHGHRNRLDNVPSISRPLNANTPVKQSTHQNAMAPSGDNKTFELSDLEATSSIAPENHRGAPLDAFTLYMQEIGRTPLLTPDEEIALAKRIRKGDRAARELMIKANLRLVVKIARDYENAGLPLLDLVSEGNIGLMTAVERFDPDKGAKLSTYAAFWIKQIMRRALANQSKTIRLPIHVVDKLYQIRQTEARLRMETNRDPSDQELSHELGIPSKRIAYYRSASAVPSSLDAPMGENADSGSLSETIPDEKTETPYRQLEAKTNTMLVRQAIQTLDAREQVILKSRFEIDGDEKETLDVIGVRFGVTRERIRQIQELALAKLRREIEKLDSNYVISA